MKLHSDQVVTAPPATVWSTLHDPDVLRACLPGCETFEQLPDGAVRLVLNLGVGAVRGRYEATMRETDSRAPETYRLELNGKGAGAFIVGAAVFLLRADGPDRTRVSVDGDAQVGGPVAAIGQRMLGSVAKLLIEQFFKCIGARADAALEAERR